MESTAVKTSVNQPTTLVIKLPDDYKAKVTWKKNGEPVNHPVLPDGSLYIINTNLSDEGEYSVSVKRNAKRKINTIFEKLQLAVVHPQPPTG